MAVHRAELARRAEQAIAADMAAFVPHIRRLAPELDPIAFPVGDGHAVLCGPGMYVNSVLGAGFGEVATDEELDRLERESSTRGLPAVVQVHDHSTPALIDRLTSRGYERDTDDAVAGLARSTADVPDPLPNEPALELVEVVSDDDLVAWQEATALGWGHDTPPRRQTSDRFARFAHAAQTPGLLLARALDDDRVLGCASLSVIGDVAVLGGMSTMPTARERGIQQKLIRLRLQLARDAGCSLAVTHAAPGGGSLRNLHRLGFETTHTLVPYVRSS